LLSVRFVESQLYEIKGIDAGVLLTAIFTLTAAACAAGMVPEGKPRRSVGRLTAKPRKLRRKLNFWQKPAEP
jgi:hypothetical protein